MKKKNIDAFNRLLVLIFLYVLLSTPFTTLSAQDSTGFELFNPLTYTTQNTGSNGLVNSNVHAIYEDKSGTIWFGTEAKASKLNNGEWTSYLYDWGWDRIIGFWEKDSSDVYLINYYGLIHTQPNGQVEYQNQYQTDPNLLQYIHTSYQQDSTIWLAGHMENGPMIHIIANSGDSWKTIQTFDPTEFGIEANWLIQSLLVDDKDIWLSTIHHIFHFDGSGWQQILNINGSGDLDFFKGNDGEVWVLGNEGIYQFQNNEMLKVHGAGGSSNCLIDKENNWWFGNDHGMLIKYDGTEFSVFALPFPFGYNNTDQNNTIRCITQLRDSTLYVGSNYGAWHITNLENPLDDIVLYNTLDGLPSNEIRSILKDKQDKFWYSTFDGLSTFDGDKWEFISQMKKLHLVADNGDVWCSKGSSHQFYLGYDSVSVFKGSEWQIFPPEETGIREISSITQSPDGKIWASGLSGITTWNGTTWQKVFHSDSLRLEKLFADSRYNLWFTYYKANPYDHTITGNGYFYEDSAVFIAEGHMLYDKQINRIIEDSNQQLWFATYQGIIQFDGENWKQFYAGSDLASPLVTHIAEDSLGGIWAVYMWDLELGASRYDGSSWTHYTTKNGLPTNKIKDIYMESGKATSSNSGSRTSSTGSVNVLVGSDLGISVFEIKRKSISSSGDENDPLGMDDNQANQNFALVYPNPALEKITIKLQDTLSSPYQVELFNSSGNLILILPKVIPSEKTISLSGLPAGIYILRIQTSETINTYRVLKN